MTRPIDSSLEPVSFPEHAQDLIRNKSIENRKLTIPESLQFKDSRTQYGENPYDPEFQSVALQENDSPKPHAATQSEIWTACPSMFGVC